MNRLTKKFYMKMVKNIAKSHGIPVQAKAKDRKAVWESELTSLNKNPKVQFNRKARTFERKFQRKDDSLYKQHYLNDRKRFSVEVKFKYSFIDRDTNNKNVKTTMKAVLPVYGNPENRNELQRLARDAALEYTRQRVSASYGDDVKVEDLDITNTLAMNPNARSLARVPVFRSYLTYPSLNLNGDDSPSAICGFKFLMDEYPKRSQSIAQLELFFNRPKEWGLTALDFEKFATHHNISVYVCDLLCNQIVCKTAKTTNRNREEENHPLIGVVANTHFYRVDDDMKSRMVQIMLGSIKREFTGDDLLQELENQSSLAFNNANKIVFLKQIPEQLEAATTYCIDSDNLNKFYMQQLDNGLAYPSKWVEEHVVAVYMQTNKIQNFTTRVFASPQFEHTYPICQFFNIPFKNQSLAGLVSKIWKEFDCEHKWKQSVFNSELKALYYDNTSVMHCAPFVQPLRPMEDIPEDYIKCGIDIKRNYTAIANEGNFYTHDVLHTVQEYKCGQEIGPGRYYVETDLYMAPFNGNGFHDYLVIREALDLGLIEHNQIIYFVPATLCKSNDKRLKQFIEYIYSLPLADKFKKNIINTLIGVFGITKSKKMGVPAITADEYEANYLYNKFNGQATIARLRTPGNKILYKVQPFLQLTQMTSDLQIRLQVVDRANMAAYKLLVRVQRFEAIPYYFKVDCVAYAVNPRDGPIPTVEPSKAKFGDYRAEKIEFKPYKFEEKKPRAAKYVMAKKEWSDLVIADKNEYFDWKKIITSNRRHIEGPGGAGKSFMIDRIREHFKQNNQDFLYCAFTNTAANNINGKTLHSVLNISSGDKEKACRKAIKKMLSDYSGIIIDEISQVGREIFSILCQLPETFKIYTFGDYRQEPPIEADSFMAPLYSNSDMFKMLMQGNKIVLTKNCRSDDGWGKACAKYHDFVEDAISDCKTPEEVFKHFNYFPFIGREILQRHVKEWSASSEFVRTLMNGHEFNRSNTANQNEINIVKTNDFRVLLNHYWMLDRKEADSLMIVPSDTNKDSQNMWLYYGLPVVMNVDSIHDRNLFKNEMYVVSCFNDTEITLKYRLLNYGVKYLIKYINKSITITHEEFANWFAPAYAITTYKVQGQTIALPHTIWEFNRMLHKSRYTALTRTTDPKLITIINVKRTDISLQDILARDEIYQYNIARIYRVTDGLKSYYGSTVQEIQDRFEEHKLASRAGTSKFYRYMREKGADKFKIRLVEQFNYINTNHILQKENMFIELYDSIASGLNERLNSISRPKKMRKPVFWCNDCRHEFKTKEEFDAHIEKPKHVKYILPIEAEHEYKPKQTEAEYDFTFRYLEKFFHMGYNGHGIVRKN